MQKRFLRSSLCNFLSPKLKRGETDQKLENVCQNFFAASSFKNATKQRQRKTTTKRKRTGKRLGRAENTYLHCKGSITVRLTSCLTGLDSAALLMFNQQQFLLVLPNPNQSNRRSSVQRYFHLRSVLCLYLPTTT